MGNVIRIVAGLGGLVAAGWLGVRAVRARKAERAGEPLPGRSTSLLPMYGVLVATALVMVATVPLS
jgi:hypothetical protein